MNVCGRCPQPRLPARCCCGTVTAKPARPGPDPRGPLALARRAHRAMRAVSRGANCCPPPKRWKSSARAHGHVLAALGTARHIRSILCSAPRAATPPRSGAGPDCCPPTRAGGQTGDRADAGSRHPSHSLGDMWAWAKSLPRRSMLHSTRWAASNALPKPRWPAATLRRAHCCSSVTSTTLKAAAANWRSMATAATTAATGHRSSSA